MKSHATETILPANLRFHLLQPNGLYSPIPFVFVTLRMARDIMQERQVILDAQAPSVRTRQEAVFKRFDPDLSVRAFENILGLFGVTRRR